MPYRIAGLSDFFYIDGRVVSLATEREKPVVIIGAGFTGLAAAYELTRRGIPVTVLEKDASAGGLAGSFEIGGRKLEKFYHHWFNNDESILELARQMDVEGEIIFSPTGTGIYFRGKFFRLSTPLDVLKFTALSISDRLRLGLLAIRARRIKDWRQLENITAEQWLIKMCGEKVYEVVWEPLLKGKFGPYAATISAVWFWNKLVLRGGSRGRGGAEVLAYYRGGFAALVDTLVTKIEKGAGSVETSVNVETLIVEDGCIKGVNTSKGPIGARAVIATAPLPVIAALVAGHVPDDYADKLRSATYLANICLVLELSQSLSDIYWLNVNDVDFPFVGIIEHTNFQSPEGYGARHIVYLSKYLPETAAMYCMSDQEVFDFAVVHIEKMFRRFQRSWVHGYKVFRARYAQPVVGCNYNTQIIPERAPIKGFYISTMAQIYPEDRGSNYAVRNGRRIGKMVAQQVCSNRPVIDEVGV